MDNDIHEYLEGQNVCVFAIEMNDGAPHAATVHFATTGVASAFVFLTSRAYRKSEPFLAKGSARASVVVGSNEGDMRTFQADGIARALTEDDVALKDAYFKKFPKKAEKYDESSDIFITFTPSWWRFTDWTAPQGKTVRSSV